MVIQQKYYEYLLPFIIISIPAYLTFSTAQNLPVWDAWHMVPLFEKMYTKQLEWSELYQTINGHHLLFPKMILLMVGHYSQYDVRYELAINFVIAIMAYIVYRSLLNDVTLTKWTRLFWATFLPILAFSLVQYENWYFGWQTCYWLCLLCALYSIYLLTKGEPSAKTVTHSSLFAFVSSYSFAAGLSVWPVGIVALVLNKKWSLLLIWTILMAICCISYFWGFEPNLNIQNEKVMMYILYFMIYLGTPLAIQNPIVAVAWGCIGLMLFWLLALYKPNHISKGNTLYLRCLAAFSIFCGILISLARVDHGIEYAALSRYTCFSSTFWVVLLALILRKISAGDGHLSSRALVMQFILLMLICSSVKSSLICITEFSNHMKRVEYAIREIKKEKIELMDIRYIRNITWDVEYTLKQIDTLKKYHLSIYAEQDGQ